MSILLDNATKIQLEGSTVDFFKFIKDDTTFYYFDSSMCGAPEPMVNAMVGLQLLKSENEKLIMINHTTPNGLFPKIQNNYDFDVSDAEDGKVQVIFSYKVGVENQTDFTNNTCNG